MNKKILLGLAGAGLTAAVYADQVFLDDVIVDGSQCVGMDCANGESFGFDTLRLKENNLRIKFVDTSSSASFPGNDWEITVNDSANGGENYFAITDVDGAKTPFKVQAGATNNQLVLESGGYVGINQANPVVHMHVTDGNSPTLRLEQDGSDGFSTQTWDIAGNEANFFVRDVTNGSQLPFKIKPGAPNNSLFVAADGDIGLNTDSPSAPLHVKDDDDTWSMNAIIENSNAIEFSGVRLQTKSSYVDINNSNNQLRINIENGAAGPELSLSSNGDLYVKGDIIFVDNGNEVKLSDLVDRIEALENQ
ncbi:MAG: hypothetical protein OXE99_04795 [Cellvibrionales bacterium]|nr:hypothetical protein [Cellvibrionales bacterium]